MLPKAMTNEDIEKYLKELWGDHEEIAFDARQKLIEGNLRLVYKLAATANNRFPYMRRDAFVSNGMLALISCVDMVRTKYTEQTPIDFRKYIVKSIWWEMRHCVRQETSVIKNTESKAMRNRDLTATHGTIRLPDENMNDEDCFYLKETITSPRQCSEAIVNEVLETPILTPGEKRILADILAGKTIVEIAEKNRWSEQTVRDRVNNIIAPRAHMIVHGRM